jgi:Tol biopolymer transport system component
MIENRENERPLESWKEIAAHLQRDPKTARRWEKHESLPVHRHRHRAGSTVYAYPSELDVWLANREVETAQSPDRKWLWHRPVAAVASTIALALVLLTAGGAPNLGTMEAQAAEGSGMVMRQVWTGLEADVSGAISPNGKLLSFADWDTGNLAIRDLEAETVRQVTKDGSMDDPMRLPSTSVWSPDGKQLAYAWHGQFEFLELRTIDLDGGEPKTLYRREEDTKWVVPIAWSPDGRHILTSISRNDGTGRLVLISAADGEVKPFITPRHHSASAFSPDGRFIIYGRPQWDQGPERDIFLMTADGEEEVALVEHPADDFVLGWSPNGAWILFASDRTGSQAFWLLEVADGKAQGEPRLVKPGIRRIRALGFAADGSFYYGESTTTEDVYMVELDPESGQVIAPPELAIKLHEGTNYTPHYSPDGKQLAYVSKRSNTRRASNLGDTLCIRSLQTGRDRDYHRELREVGLNYVIGPQWSPDSSSILFAGSDGRWGIYHITLETGQVRPVVRLAEGAWPPRHVWSGDGGSFYYTSFHREERRSRLLHRTLGSGEERELWSGAEELAISLSPDGESLSFIERAKERVLRLLPARGGATRELYRFEQPQVYSHTWSPDGNYIYFASRLGGPPRCQLWRIPVEGGDAERIAVEATGILVGLTFHPEGRHLAFASHSGPSSESGVWVLENFLPEPPAAE